MYVCMPMTNKLSSTAIPLMSLTPSYSIVGHRSKSYGVNCAYMSTSMKFDTDVDKNGSNSFSLTTDLRIRKWLPIVIWCYHAMTIGTV